MTLHPNTEVGHLNGLFPVSSVLTSLSNF
jgi:hypothetical protein